MPDSSPLFNSERKLAFYKIMFESRQCDLREQRLIRQGRGAFHVSSMGHEGLAIFSFLMQESDYCFPYYRGRTISLAKGLSSYDFALAYFAKKASSSAGRQLTGHYSSRKHKIWSVPSVIANHLLPAAGAAWGMQIDKKDDFVLASIGEGGTRQGDFYEAVSFAKEKNLPIIFIVEDNNYAISTPTSNTHALAINNLSNDWQVIDGSNINLIYETASAAIQKARSNQGPSFIWAKLERLSSHTSNDDHRTYRSEEDIASMQEKDPIARFRNQLIQEQIIVAAELEALEVNITEKVREIYEKAEQTPNPEPGYEQHNIFAEAKIDTPASIKSDQSYRMADALNETFDQLLTQNPNTYFFGEDIEDPLGGVFRLTKGLSTKYPGRVMNSPLAESSILGLAAGLASYGKRPIFEIQFVDFITPGWSHIINSLSNLRWRSNGDWNCPAIIYAPSGAYLPGGGIWHSQSNEASFAHIPGLRIVVPSTPEDASGYFHTALANEDPTIILLPKHLFWITQIVPQQLNPLPFGKAALRQNGNDLTIVAWGNTTEIVQKAIAELKTQYSIELIDLRSIVPWDKELITQSVRKTGRLVIIHEDNERCSVGQMIITHMMQDHETWERFIAPPIMLSRDNVHVGYNEHCEYSCLPSKDDLVEAVHKTMSISHKPQTLSVSPSTTPNIQVTLKENSDLKTTPSEATNIITIKLPNLGEGLLEARIVEICKKPGDTIKPDDTLCEVETDKAVFPVESAYNGIVESWVIKENEVATVGQALLSIKVIENSKLLNNNQTSPPQKEITLTTVTNNESTTLTEAGSRGALSKEILRQLEGVLPAGLVVSARWHKIREVRSKLRGRSSAGAFSHTTLVAWCITKALEIMPNFRRLLQKNSISDPIENFDLGFAVALENDTLETATITNANQRSWTEFVAGYREGLQKAKTNQIQSKSRSPLLLTSMSVLNMRFGHPIVVPPAMSTLFIGESHFEVTVDKEGNMTPQEVVNLEISFDHRWANGAGAGRFLKAIKENIESLTVENLK